MGNEYKEMAEGEKAGGGGDDEDQLTKVIVVLIQNLRQNKAIFKAL